jgi:iron complex outermembrane receptor protein
LTLNTKLINTDNTKLGLGFNATYNDIKITKLTSSVDESYKGIELGGITGGVGNNIQIHSVGYAPNSFYVYQQVYDTDGKPIEGVYVDRNNDNKIDSNDKYHFKRPNAAVTLGLRTDFSYKNLDFNMFWRSSLGNYIYNNVDSNHGYKYQMLNESFPNVINNGTHNVLETNFENGGTDRYMSDYYIQEASFLKLDNLSLGYTFNQVFNLSSLRLFASTQNVLTITDYTGNDPEVYGGIDYNVYPVARTFVLGINVNF